MNFKELVDMEERICEAYSDLIRSLSNGQLKERIKGIRDAKLSNIEKLSLENA